MKKKNVYACLLAGGKGTRLWPITSPTRSKSFTGIAGRKPLIIDTLRRLKGLIEKRNIIFVADKSQLASLKKTVKNIPPKNILVEPFGRNTASAVALAAAELKPDDIMVVLPTDSLIENEAAFKKTIERAVSFVTKTKNALVCIGVKPKHVNTAFGYIKLKSRKFDNIYAVDRYIEKPRFALAARLVKSARYLWNAGIFVFKVKDILASIKSHAPLLYRELCLMKSGRRKKIDAYMNMKDVSIDYQIMEKAENLYCVKGDFSWVDIGSWVGAGRLLRKDRHGNACFGDAELIDTRDSVVYNSGKKKLGLAGLRDMIVVNTDEGILVCGKKDAEKVRKLGRFSHQMAQNK